MVLPWMKQDLQSASRCPFLTRRESLTGSALVSMPSLSTLVTLGLAACCMSLNLPPLGRGSETGRTSPSRTNCPRPPAEHGAHHQQDTHRGPCVYPQISKYRGRGRPRAPYHHSFPGLLSLASNGPRISGPMEHDPSSGRHHSRLPACHALFGEVEGRASRHNHFDAFPGRTNIQFFLSVFVSDRERVDMCSVQVLNV